MAIAHVCLGCGLDLARVRACREPHYGLWIVTCPRCQRVTPRRRHAIAVRGRAVVRLISALCALIVQFVFIGLLGAMAMLCVLSLRDRIFGEATIVDSLAVRVLWILTAAGTGAWITAGLSHLRRWQAWGLWACALLIGLIAISTLELWESMPWDVHTSSVGMVADEIVQRLRVLGIDILVVAVLLLLSVIGVPIGWALRRINSARRRFRWRARRRRKRLAGAA